MARPHLENLHASNKPRHARVRFRSQGASLGLPAASPAELIHKLERGLSYDSLQRLSAQSDIPVSRLAEVLAIPERTLARRKTSGRLTLDESERLLRIANVFEKAVELFEGDVQSAVNWMTSSKKALEGHTPLDYSRTETGAREVESLVGQLEHGVFV